MSRTAAKFSHVLIANRGEIALRIIRTLRAEGIASTVVYHAADRGSPAVAAADSAVEITGSTPVSVYLDAPQIIAAAKTCGANAIHPGYGFLSENAAFARAVEQAGLVFIGPTPAQIELMGDKVRARNFVARSGFPVAASAIEDDAPATFRKRAMAVGLPLLIKPAAGGGGKGMRIVRDAARLDEELARARSEAERYFGDGRLYVERYMERPRHIEVQVLGDAHGNVVHLFERECSVQRRFQKIVEESPSPGLTREQRAHVATVAAGIARAAGYRNAGTVEFIYGGGEVYFLEMNTRLQVEHPVTEEVTGRDLVALQLHIAAGNRLPFTQDDLSSCGHAIELRIYAESAARGFAPTTGRVLRLDVPQGDGIRFDAGIRQGQSITPDFDPMLGKLIVRGADRAEAIARADAALRDLVLLGCETNAAFLRRLIAHPAFKDGSIHTGFVDAHPEIAAEPPLTDAERDAAIAAAALSLRPVRDAADAISPLHAAMGGWRN